MVNGSHGIQASLSLGVSPNMKTRTIRYSSHEITRSFSRKKQSLVRLCCLVMMSCRVAFVSPRRLASSHRSFASTFVSHNRPLTTTGSQACALLSFFKDSPHPQQQRTFAAISPKLSKSIHRTKRNANPKNKDLHRADRILSTRTELSRSQAGAIIKNRRLGYLLPNENRTDQGEDEEDADANRVQSVPGPKFKLPMDVILYLDRRKVPQLPPTLFVHHKDKFILSAMSDRSKQHLGQALPSRIAHVKAHPVGRLDYDTSGLILFSQDGPLTQRLLHPKFAVEKEYEAVVIGDASVQSGEEDGGEEYSLKRALREGVETTEGIHTASLTHVEVLEGEERRLIVKSHIEGEEKHGREGAFFDVQDLKSIVLSRIRLVVQEGKYRMVRRMLANCGHAVVELKRLRHGNIELGDLGVGEFRDCTQEEIDWAESLFGKREEKNER